jgi:hypothetical protein
MPGTQVDHVVGSAETQPRKEEFGTSSSVRYSTRREEKRYVSLSRIETVMLRGEKLQLQQAKGLDSRVSRT